MRRVMVTLLAATAVAGCGQGRDSAAVAGNDAGEANVAAAATSWPTSLIVVGDGFPKAGDACRIIGETPATIDYLDDSATLAGCPTPEQAAALGGKVVATVDGITLVSVPRSAEAAAAGDGDGQGDSKVAGTDYNATADVPCSGIKGAGPSCKAGVTRSADQIAIDVSIPGATRTLLFDGKGTFVTHKSSEADGSAALQSRGKREGDWQIITVGPETYRVPDAFVIGD